MQPSSLSRLRGRREITFAVLAVAASSFALLQSLIVPVLATIQVEFHTSQTTVTWVLTAYKKLPHESCFVVSAVT